MVLLLLRPLLFLLEQPLQLFYLLGHLHLVFVCLSLLQVADFFRECVDHFVLVPQDLVSGSYHLDLVSVFARRLRVEASSRSAELGLAGRQVFFLGFWVFGPHAHGLLHDGGLAVSGRVRGRCWGRAS